MTEILVEQVYNADRRWLGLCQQSHQGTPFIYDDYLEACNLQSINLLASKGEIVIGGLCMAREKKSGIIAHSMPFSQYQGLIFPYFNQETYGIYRTKFEAETSLVAHACAIFPQVAFSNHWSVKDIRPLSWHNYHTPEKGTVHTTVAYTAIKDISTEEKINHGLISNRQRDIKKSKETFKVRCFHTDSNDELEVFLKLYRLTFLRQAIRIPESEIDKAGNIARTAMANSYGRMFYAEIPSGEIISALFLLFDKRCAYYLFGANHPDYRKYGAASDLMLQAMHFARAKGIGLFDFVGANSPQRGDFKLSFGAELMPYYCADFVQNINTRDS